MKETTPNIKNGNNESFADFFKHIMHDVYKTMNVLPEERQKEILNLDSRASNKQCELAKDEFVLSVIREILNLPYHAGMKEIMTTYYKRELARKKED